VFGRDHLVSRVGVPYVLNNAPYYAFETTSVASSTHGGIKQDKTCQAVDVLGNTIPGLYVAGNVSGYCNCGILPGTRIGIIPSGFGFGGALAFGRYCAELMAKLKNWDAKA
jgi:predicted oxidoreductase